MNAPCFVSASINANQFYTYCNTNNKTIFNDPISQVEQNIIFAYSIVFSMSCVINRNNCFHTSHNNTKNNFNCSIRLNDTNRQASAMSGDLNLDRLDEIAALEYDWDGYGAKRFSNKLIEKCKNILYTLSIRPKIYPTGRQSIQFQYELEDRSYLEFEIFETKTVCLLVPKRKYSNAVTKCFSEFEIDKIKEIVNNFYGQNSNT